MSDADKIIVETIDIEEGNIEPAVLRVALALAITMIAEEADKHDVGLNGPAIMSVANDLLEGAEQGVAFMMTHAQRMAQVQIVPKGSKVAQS